MAMYQSLFCYFIYFSIILYTNLTNCNGNENREVYIVYMGSIPKHNYVALSHHQSLLDQVLENNSVANSLIRSYQRSFNGFAAKLTEDEVKKLSNKKEIVSIFPSKTLQLHTTRSWDFLGFNDKIYQDVSSGSDIIVGLIDSGIWPESESFNDKGYPPPPKKWKGSCANNGDFHCNNKIIGARDYTDNCTRDYIGHGTHTASIAAGNLVNNVSFYGLANGTARGGLPSARIAAYKACDEANCKDADILAAFDDAIADGVDIISASLGGSPTEFFRSTIAIGAFHAFEHGILTVHSAGNDGYAKLLTGSVAPWLLSVAASSIDRKIIGKIVLGNGTTLIGASVNTASSNETMSPLTYGGKCIAEMSRLCGDDGCSNSNSNSIKGKILVCDVVEGIELAVEAGAAGIVYTGVNTDVSFIHPIPALKLNFTGYATLRAYSDSLSSPKGVILKSEAVKDSYAPVVASFSSPGPNEIVPEILKPDISAPGIDILAAYSPIAPFEDDFPDKRHVSYHMLSGTSMSAPHAAGVAAYIKSIHKDLSPSAIKSAIMTTASMMDPARQPSKELSYGSGQINPLKAAHPGLVYEIFKEDYLKLLCGIGYSDTQVKQISRDNTTCSKYSVKLLPRNLNYPSFAANITKNKAFELKFHRTVTNVGLKDSTYKLKAFKNSKLNITVIPEVLSFTSLYEKKSFVVKVSGEAKATMPGPLILSDSLEWYDGKHNVRSPIVVYDINYY